MILQENGILPLGKCHVYEHQGTEFPELYYRALRVECSVGGDKTESLLLMANSVTEKAQWMADFSQVRRGRGVVWDHVTVMWLMMNFTIAVYGERETKQDTPKSKVWFLLYVQTIFPRRLTGGLGVMWTMLTAQTLCELEAFIFSPTQHLWVWVHSLLSFWCPLFSSVLENRWNWVPGSLDTARSELGKNNW